MLLDAFTMFLAYIGDAGAKDGYLTGITEGIPTYSVEFHIQPLEPEEIIILVQKVLNFIKYDVPIEAIDEDILKKLIILKALVNEKNQSLKDELFTYMTEMLE